MRHRTAYKAVIFGLTAVTWFFLTPPLETMATLRPGWIALILLRNVALDGMHGDARPRAHADGSYFHYLHHRYFECNYASDEDMFLDKLFGSMHDGTPEARGGASYRYAVPPPEVAQRVEAMAAVCDRHGIDLATAALQFPLAHPLVTAAIPGATRPEYVTSNVQRLQTPIPAALWADLKAARLLRPDAPVPGT